MPTHAIYGGSFNPPGRHHRAIATTLLEHFDRVVVVPCGPRPDKPTSDALAPVYRAAMADITFSGLDRLDVDLFDLEQATFTRSVHLGDRYAEEGEVWFVVGVDHVLGGGVGESLIQTLWTKGEALWREARFAVIARPDDVIDPADMPPCSKVIRIEAEGSSALIREHLFMRRPYQHLVTPKVADYIDRYSLYSGRVPNRATSWDFGEAPRVLIFGDDRNPKVALWRKEFEHLTSDEPECIIVLGGDGTMLKAIQTHWRLRLPFFGVNAGHLGFLLNRAEDVLGGRFPPKSPIVRLLPMLYVEIQHADGSWTEHLTFNDAWVERETGQSAWLEVKVNGRVRMDRLICDGALVSTAAASTAYARSMGATPLLADSPAWLLVGSNVMQPLNWTSALLSPDAIVEMRGLHTEKRPLRAYLHGVPLGEVIAMRARVSRIATAELAFCREHDMAEKIAQIQFPQRVLI